jgi:hypothetical protein
MFNCAWNVFVEPKHNVHRVGGQCSDWSNGDVEFYSELEKRIFKKPQGQDCLWSPDGKLSYRTRQVFLRGKTAEA